MSLIGLCGYKGSGKSFTANILTRHFAFHEVAFADPLKAGIISMLALTHDQLYDPHQKEVPDAFWGVTPRILMQIIGTELMRERLPQFVPQMHDVWIRSAQKQIAALLAENKRVVVSDVRFENEARLIRSLGGQVWQIQRHGPACDTDTHSSERLDFQADIIVHNDASETELLQTVTALLKK